MQLLLMQSRPAVDFLVAFAVILTGTALFRAIQNPKTDLLTVVVAIAAVMQAGAAIIMMRGLKHAEDQAAMARRSVEHMQLSSERQLRAYVDVLRVVVDEFNEGAPLVCTGRIRNSGQTPARRLNMTYRAVIVPTADVDAAFLGDDVPTLPFADVSPGREMWFTEVIPWAEWAPFEDALRAGRMAIVLVGKAEYLDVFGGKRLIEFKRYYCVGYAGEAQAMFLCDTGNSSS